MGGRHFRLAALALASTVLAAAQSDPTAALIERVTGGSSRLEADLRALTDEIGGRVTGSAGYEKALKWGVDAFKRAGVDSVKLESYLVPAKWEGISAFASVVEPFPVPLRVVSFALAPSTSGALTAPLVDAGSGRKTDFEKLGERARGAIALVRSNPMKSFEDLFGEYLAAPEMMHAAIDHGAAAILFLSTRPRDLMYRHTITWGDAESDTFDKVDPELARRNAAVAAVVVVAIANAPGRPGKRQDRAEVEQLLEKSRLDAQMKTYGLWGDWKSGKRGREK